VSKYRSSLIETIATKYRFTQDKSLSFFFISEGVLKLRSEKHPEQVISFTELECA